MLNAFQVISDEVKPDGAIITKQLQTPITQKRLISSEDFLFITRTIKGMFHKGRIIAAISEIILYISPAPAF